MAEINAPLSDRLRTIGARLCLSAETQLDGQMLLELATEMAKVESDLATFDEDMAELAMSLNDPLNCVQAIVAKFAARRAEGIRITITTDHAPSCNYPTR